MMAYFKKNGIKNPTSLDMADYWQSQEGYTENVGTIAIGVSNAQIEMMLDDPRIRMIIPYHKSGINHTVARMGNIDLYKDYTYCQNTRYRDADGKVKKLEKDMNDFNWYEYINAEKKDGSRKYTAKKVADMYLKYCDKNNYVPKFDEFRNNENYYKLLEDFVSYDKDGNYVPQKAVECRYPEAKKLEQYIKESLSSQESDEKLRASEMSDMIDEANESDAYGGRVMEGYLNITKPASKFNKTINSRQLQKLIKAVSIKEAQGFVDEGSYDNINDALKDTWISNYVYTYDMSIDKAYKETADSILNMSENDFDIIQEIMSGLAIRDYQSAYDFYETLTDTLGIDGYETEWEDARTGETTAIYVAFNSNQFKNIDNENPTSNEDIRYSKKEISYQLNDVLHNTFNSTNNMVNFGETPNVLYNEFGFEHYPVLMNAKHVYSMMVSETKAKEDGRYNKDYHYHNLGLNRMKSLLSSTESAAMFIKSNNDPHNLDLVAVTNLYDKDGDNIIVVYSPNKEGYISCTPIDTNKMKSAYGKQSINNYIQRAYNEGRILSINEKNSYRLFDNVGLQLSNILKQGNYVNNIQHYIEEIKKVNTNNFNQKMLKKSLKDNLELNNVNKYSRKDSLDWNDEFLSDENIGKSAKNTANILEEGFDILKNSKIDISHAEMNKIADKFLEKYNSKTGVEKFAKQLESIFAYIQKNDVSINATTVAQTQKILDAMAQNKIDALQSEVNTLKTQNMFCGIPRINPYGYGVYAYNNGCNGCGCRNI